MKRKLIFSLLLFASLISFSQDEGYLVKIKLPDVDLYRPVLAYPLGKKAFRDSNYVQLDKGWIAFKGKVSAPVIARIELKNENLPYAKGSVSFFFDE